MQNGNQDICNLVNDMIETWLETKIILVHLFICMHTWQQLYPPSPRLARTLMILYTVSY